MRKADYQPGALGAADARNDGEGWTLVFVRQLAHPPQVVWRALTDPDELAAWAPFDPDRDLGRTGAATLTMAGGPEQAPAERLPAEVRRADPPRLLEYTWGSDLLRWELEPAAGGTRLTLRHTVADPSWLPKVAAGWHICLDVAERALAGDRFGRIVADEAMAHGWERLAQGYAARFGLADASAEAPLPGA